MLASIARVKLTTLGGGASSVSVVTEISLPRGEWKGEPLNFHVAYGAPAPRAIDAHLVAVGDGALEPDDAEAGDALSIEHAPRRPANAHSLIGRDVMAGVVVHVTKDQMTKALARGNMASLRIRSVVDATAPDATGASSIVVRLGVSSRATPLTLGRIAASSAPSTKELSRVDARLCGPEADPHSLAVSGVPKPPPSAELPPIAPVLSVRHASDDLCVRFWHKP